MGKIIARFQRVMRAAQTAWSIFGVTLVFLLVAECGFRIAFAVRDRASAPLVPDPRILAEGYNGETWPIDHYREIESLEERWYPYVYFRPKPTGGKTISIGPDGLRATWQPPEVRSARNPRNVVKLLTVGGSSLWGFGARDQQTIPSILARMLQERGIIVEVKNLAELGYVSTQEVIGLLREIQQGYRPDFVIFYDGVNDTTSALLCGEAGLTTNEVNRQKEFNLLQSPGRLAAALAGKIVADSGAYRLARGLRSRFGEPVSQPAQLPTGETLNRLATHVVDRYAANIKLVETLGRGYGFVPLFFWQPTIFDKDELTSAERDEAQKFAWAQPAFKAVYERVSSSPELNADAAFHDVSRSFASENSLVFIDYCHITESANTRIAELMAAAISELHPTPR